MGLSCASDKEGALAAVEAVKQLALDVKLPSFSSLSVKAEDYPGIALTSAKNGSNGSNPRPMGESDYMAVIKMALR
jgi:alcohol dehydrogenase